MTETRDGARGGTAVRLGLRPLAAAVWLAACATGGFDLATLPEDTLAVVYRTREESERRVDMLERAKDPSRLGRTSSSVYDTYSVRVEDAMDAFGLGGSPEERAALLLGRMARIAARSGDVQSFEFALAGDRPFDWSPDRGRLLFRSLRHDGIQLYEWDRESGQVRPLTAGPASHESGCYGPDGRLAFSRHEPSPDRESQRSRIFVTERGGGRPRAVSEGPRDLLPAWSPDGSVLLFQTADPAGRLAIAAVGPDGDAPPRLIARGRDPDFTPDGRFVVYSAQTREGWRLYLMLPDGSGKRPLGRSPRDEHDPRVSPDGRFVVYVADDERRQQLRVRTIDGSGDRPLLFHGDGFAPVW